MHASAAGGKDGSGQRRRRRLSVGTGDSRNRGGTALEDQVDLAANRNTQRPRNIEDGGVPRDPGTWADDGGPGNDVVVIAAQDHLHLRGQLGGKPPKAVVVIPLDDAHGEPVGTEHAGTGDAAAAQADDHGKPGAHAPIPAWSATSAQSTAPTTAAVAKPTTS